MELPPAEVLREVHDEGALLSTALQLAKAAETGASAPPASAWAALQPMLLKLGGIACAQRGRKVGGKQKRVVRFAVHDLSCLAPPKVSNPGSETEQDRLIEDLVSLIALQHQLLPPPSSSATAAAASDTATATEAQEGLRSALGALQNALAALEGAEALSVDMRTSASFYAFELSRWLSDAASPVLVRRAAELLSSSVRLHLSAVLSEEEGAETVDPHLQAIHQRVLELAALHSFNSAQTGEDSAEHFGALVTYCLKDLHEHASLLAEGTAVRASLLALHEKKAKAVTEYGAEAAEIAIAAEDEEAAPLRDLTTEQKEGLLSWAQAQMILEQVFGQYEPSIETVMAAPLNRAHFERLRTLAAHVPVLGASADEAYLTPLSDMAALKASLIADEVLGKAALEGMMLFSSSGKARATSRRKARK